MCKKAWPALPKADLDLGRFSRCMQKEDEEAATVNMFWRCMMEKFSDWEGPAPHRANPSLGA